ncbi:MAG: hypothetical protein HKN87_09570 [Saprospiraceae bacterium]|nr:hypothetical protein [Saprospiraceae bacterium]
MLTLCIISCDEPDRANEESEAQQIVDAAILAAGGSKYENIELSFDFREHRYTASRSEGAFEYTRLGVDSLGREVRDVLNNQGLFRYIGGALTEIAAEDSIAYANSVNSVIYFALLPYFLNDPAAIKTYLGKMQIEGNLYHKIKVVFKQEGGGKDYQDEFVYWFNDQDFGMDYLAYNYLTEGGGSRFRQAFNVRRVAGIRFADFYNLKPSVATRDIQIFDSLLLNSGLEKLSEIRTENIKVN